MTDQLLHKQPVPMHLPAFRYAYIIPALFLFIITDAAYLFAQDAAKIPWKYQLEDALSLSQKENKPVFVYIYADWCKVCKKLDRTLFQETETIRALGSFIPVRIDGEKDIAAADRFKTRGFPTMVFLDKNGYQLEKSEGGTDSEAFRRQLARVIRKSTLSERIMTALQQPKSITPYFEAGIYYSGTGNHSEARSYFLKAWSENLPDPDHKRKDSLYNAAVSSMELKDYSAAVSQWNIYLLQNHLPAAEEADIRYYRALSLKELGLHKEASEDLRYTAQNSKNRRIRKAAAELLGRLR